MRFLSHLRTDRVQPPVRRVLAVDAGSRRLKLTLVKSSFGRVEILREESLDLHEEGLVTTEELQSHLHAILADCGNPPIALTLSQHLSISQVIELPQSAESEVRRLIEDEIVKLSGVSDSAIVHDFVEVESRVPNRQQFWVTLGKEREIEERVRQLGLDQDDLCEVTTAANALVAAYRATAPQSADAILVHLGAQNTMLVVLARGHAVFATSFPGGSDAATRVIAKARRLNPEAAESLKRGTNLFAGPEAVPEFLTYINGWVTELKRQLNEWCAHRGGTATDLAAFSMVASGVAFNQPGLLDHLNTSGGLKLRPWPNRPGLPAQGFEIAFGTALQALSLTAQPVSLLPPARRAIWQRRLTTQKFEFANAVLVVLCFLALVCSAWQNLMLARHKEALLAKIKSGQESQMAHQTLTTELLTEYESLRPLLDHKQNTQDTLATLALLQQSRSNRALWYVLLADQQSYFRHPLYSPTNRIARTNPPAPLPGRLPGGEAELPSTLTGTNAAPIKPGLIAELCVPEEPEVARKTLSQIVNELGQAPNFAKVDLLSDDLRREVADPRLVLPDRHFALALDFAAAEFHQAVPARKLRPPEAAGPSAKAFRRPGSANSDEEPGSKSPPLP